MSVSGISGSSFFNTPNANVQNQQQWQQEFQKLAQELQSGSLASPEATTQATAQTELTALQQASPTAASPPATSPTATPSPAQSSSPNSTQFNVPQGTPKHAVHLHRPHHLQIDAGTDGDQDSNPLGQASPSATASTAQQAYSSWQQDLQQVGLNSDLLTAQSADWQPVSVSV
jgi:hypothetical protein